MHKFFVIDKDYECRRFYRNLCHVENFQTAAPVRRRLLHGNCFCKDLIKHTSLDTHSLILNYRIQCLKHSGNPKSCSGRNKHDFCIRHKGKDLPNTVSMFVNGLVIFLNSIPFIHCNDHALAFLMGNSGNFCILLCNAF